MLLGTIASAWRRNRRILSCAPGFLIGGILLDHRDSPHYFKTFYVRRVCRILPLYFVLVIPVAAAIFLVPQSSGAGQWLLGKPMPVWSYLTFTQNFVMAGTGAFGCHALGATWSLAIEEQFYLLFPWVIRYVPRAMLLRVLPSSEWPCAGSMPGPNLPASC